MYDNSSRQDCSPRCLPAPLCSSTVKATATVGRGRFQGYSQASNGTPDVDSIAEFSSILAARWCRLERDSSLLPFHFFGLEKRDDGKCSRGCKVIFDPDGLIDSETPDYLSWKEVYARHGLDLTVEDWAAVVGRRDIDLYAPLRQRNVDVAAEGESRRRRLAALFEDYLTPAPGVLNLIDQLRLAGVLRGLASNSDGAYVFEVVERLELRDAFDAIITRDEVTRAKPAPDIFLAAVARLGVEAQWCVALEDSHPGVAAAKAAGLKCVAVPTVFTRNHDLSQADLLVTSLDVVTLEILSRLVSEGTVADPQNPTWRHDPTQP